MRLDGSLRNLYCDLRSVWHRAQIAKRPARAALRGLHKPVEVLTDDWGVPHIYAETLDDLFFAQGYVTARDRLFQLDYNRHGATGRLCELVGKRPLPSRELTVHLEGKTTFDVDCMLRSFGLEQAAKASWESHSDEAKQYLRAYTAGINAFLGTRPWSMEHLLLQRRPKPWSEIDSLVMLKAIAFELNFAWRAVLLGALFLDAGVPEDLAKRLWPHTPVDQPAIVDSKVVAQMAKAAAGARSAAEAALGIGNASGVGSNSWVVAASHSKSGAAMLANDTHLTLTAPVPWHEVHLHGAGLHLHGFALPGVPGIAIGRTPRHTWGITAGLVHDLDLFVEKTNPEDPNQYLTPDGWREFDTRKEVIHISGQGYVEHEVRSTRHGPVLDACTTGAPEGHLFAIQWTGHEPGRDLDALIGVWRAQSPEEFREALQHIVCPTYNVSYADLDGRIAYTLAGRIPKRKKGTPCRPLEGWTGEWDWQGTVPYAENPWKVDPPEGFLVTANNRPAGADFPYELGGLFEPSERFNRIVARLATLGTEITVEDMKALQLDVHSSWGLLARDRLLELAGGIDALAPDLQSPMRAAAEIWRDWDGEASAESAGAAIGLAAAHLTGLEVIRRVAGEEAARGLAELGSFSTPTIEELPELREALAAHGIDLADAIRSGFDQAFAHCSKMLGPDPATWRWGDIHPLLGVHRFGRKGLGAFFSIGPIASPGGPDTVNRGDVNSGNGFRLTVGPALRLVSVAGDPGPAHTSIPGGQSGSRLSPHYDDQVRDFVAGHSKSISMRKEDIGVVTREQLEPLSDETPKTPAP